MPRELAPIVGTLLIVDDDPNVRRAIRIMCEQDGINVVGDAGSGIEAEDMARQHQPTFIVLDYKMPYGDGDTTARQLRRISPEAKIIAFSAYLDGQPDWADAYVSKDQIDRLLKVIAEII